ncbi:MAG: hypothetical protein LQ339_007147 [Xanthoria mediterranea]|nr:MAG: hypothetical protein LQ339_007147 [Xanthoria mediterranea]
MAPSQPAEPSGGLQRGPHPSYIQIAKPYVFESRIQDCMLAAGITEARDEDIRLQAVAWIDNVRRAMHLPVRTYNTAVVYFHKFRLLHPDNTGYIDAAAAALFTACKIEDTLKKSRDILCAAHNEKLTASEQVTPDDPIFENHAKIIIGIERLMLEASGFDFRNRYPQRLVIKLAKVYSADKDSVGKTAYKMSLDLYRTFAPLKQTTPTMAIACVELAGRVLGKPATELESGKDYKQWRITRQEVMETLLDLVDLYTHHRSSTIVGQDHALEEFISIRIALNQEASAEKLARFTQSNREKAMTNGTATNGVKEKKDSKGLASPRSIASPKDIKSPQPIGLTSVTGTSVQGKPGLKEGTVRFMLDPERARDEKHTVADFFKMDEEEYEVLVESDRRRDSGICMSSHVVEGAQTSPLIHMDMEQHQNDTIKQSWDDRHIKEKNCSDQKDHPFSGEEDGKCDIPPDPTWRVSKVPLPDQGLAFKAALQGPTRPSTAMRFGDYEGQARVDKENYPEVKEYGFQPANPDSPKTRMPKRPLAAQGMAFQAALQQSDSVSPNIRGGASRHGEENVNIRIKGAAGAAVQHRAATRRGQLDKNMQPRQQRRLH